MIIFCSHSTFFNGLLLLGAFVLPFESCFFVVLLQFLTVFVDDENAFLMFFLKIFSFQGIKVPRKVWPDIKPKKYKKRKGAKRRPGRPRKVRGY